ncbi:rhomboid family intramembrane serine protease [Paenibacillus tritici]|uniref:Rhomboid family intramembrane serine protease n=1 Tax=Paenibacillus tritici TaxID=1873425 RepID=A0ABX2DUK7_9BACL|nr:rhomboid family intramembrane serine protease [Paenibacillus tritici]NQX48065.1 rhomboid family intramembrane serine protease [Paenibacillus tritici]QUL56988.1 rhomboid family intramembrane serine protease [Paenibacillus tritici]
MIFIRYEKWRSYLRYYPVTCALILANVIMFIVLSLNGGSTNLYTLVKYGATVNVGPEKDELWRYASAMFLHNGFAHLFFNSFSLLVFAPPLERLMGWWRYALLYLGGGFLANLIGVAVSSRGNVEIGIVSVGASGAIYAIYGAFLYIAVLQRGMMDEGSRKTLYGLLVVGIVMSFATPHIDYMAHIGGLIAGFFIYGLMIRIFKRKRR